MATGTLRRHSTAPTAKITVTSGGSPLDLTDYSVKFLMWAETTLSSAVANTTDTYIVIPASNWSILETNDVVLINHERMQITAYPSAEPTSTCHVSVTRGYTIPATNATVYASTTVAGTGTNIFVLGSKATFDLDVDGAGAQTVEVTSTATSSNYLISHLVTDVQNAIDSVCTTATATVSNIGNRLYIQSDSTGTSSSIVISNPNSTATNELGIVADTDYGESSVSCNKATHDEGDTVYIIKIENDARISDATGGVAEYEWRTNDLNRVGTFYCSFEFKDDSGRYFELPTDNSYTIQVVADCNDRVLLEGE